MQEKIKHFIGIFATLFVTSVAHAQESLTEPQLLGAWQVMGSKFEETYIFKGNHELQVSSVQTKKDGKPITPITYIREGAYTFGSGACSLGQTQGNLFMAQQSMRCCYKIYKMGATLVFDNISPSPSTFLSCENKTLRVIPPKNQRPEK
jgi:hypothetical protein